MYYIVVKGQVLGPYSRDGVAKYGLQSSSLVWHYGLKDWVFASEVDDLRAIISSSNDVRLSRNYSGGKKVLALALGLCCFIFIYFQPDSYESNCPNVAEHAVDSEENFELYVNNFYRDVFHLNVYPQKPEVTIVKFANLDKLLDHTHIMGVSCGLDADDRIEIYINPSSWSSLNKAGKYALMYHELGHDVLNLPDLEDVSSNKGKMMLSTKNILTMDEFIESYKSMVRTHILDGMDFEYKG